MTKSSRKRFLAGYVAGALFALAVISGGLFLTKSVSASPEATTFATINAQELKSMIDFKGATVIDVRDVQAYTAGHIPGALQIPLARIEGEASYLPKDKPIVTYCTCPNEESSGQAAMILANAGVQQVFALKGGLAAWTEAGNQLRSGLEN